jgi:hypothetical protein
MASSATGVLRRGVPPTVGEEIIHGEEIEGVAYLEHVRTDADVVLLDQTVGISGTGASAARGNRAQLVTDVVLLV